MNFILVFLLLCMVLSAVAAVMLRSLIKSAIALASASIFLTIVLFLIGAPWAAVFELSVCAGLITAIFISSISLTTPYDKEELKAIKKERLQRFIALPFILFLTAILAGAYLVLNDISLVSNTAIAVSTFSSFKETLWNLRQADILGQIIVILAGVFAVVILFKERDQV